MNDNSKTKRELIKELAAMRRRIHRMEEAEATRQQDAHGLRESKELYTGLVDTIPDIIVRTDLEGKILFVNDYTLYASGYSWNEVEGRNILMFIDSGDWERLLQNALLMMENRLGPKEYHLIMKDGRKVPFEVNGDVLRSEDGAPFGLVFVCRDITERKQAEEALQESQKLYTTVVNSIPDIIVRTDIQGKIIFVNDYTLQISGYRRDEMEGQSMLMFIAPEDHNRAIQNTIFRLESPLGPREYKMVAKDGRIIPFEVNGDILRDEDGTPIGLVNVCRDITERKEAENAMRESEKKYRELVDFLPISLFESDLQGNATSLNPAIYKTFGYTQPDFKNGFQMIIPEEQERLAETVPKLLSGEKKGPSEYTGIRKDGSTFPFMIFPSVIIRQGKPVGFRGAIIDLTSQKQVQEDLRKAEEKYRKMIERMEDGYFEVDLAGNFTFVNDAEIKMLGYSRDELIGMNNRQYQDAANAQRAYQIFGEVYRTGRPIKASAFEIIRKNGTKGFHEITVSLIRDAKGKPTGFRGLSRDVTERRQTEEEKRNLEERLNRAEKMEAIGQLAGGVAHVLNNILGILNGYAELLLTEIPEGRKARGHVEKILQSTERGTLIIQDLLTLSKGGVMASEMVNLNTVVSGFLETSVFKKMKGLHSRVIFKTECQQNLLNIKGSRGHLEKMLTNLVSNAAEAISGEGTITIRTENRYVDKNSIRHNHEIKGGDYVILSISDTGTGIPDEYREKIFEPFYTKKTMGRNGTGLGLSIVWGTVKDHNGHIDVQTKVGEGTVFTLYFPASSQA